MTFDTDRRAAMDRHPAGRGSVMTDDNVIPLRRKGDQPVEFEVGPPLPKRQQTELLLAAHGEDGLTVKELEARTGWHHGAASAQLSWLHQQGKAVRLQVKREGCRVYVAPGWVADRPVSPRRLNQQSLIDGMARALRRDFKPCSHDPDLPHETCKRCEVRILLRQYDETRV